MLAPFPRRSHASPLSILSTPVTLFHKAAAWLPHSEGNRTSQQHTLGVRKPCLRLSPGEAMLRRSLFSARQSRSFTRRQHGCRTPKVTAEPQQHTLGLRKPCLRLSPGEATLRRPALQGIFRPSVNCPPSSVYLPCLGVRSHAPPTLPRQYRRKPANNATCMVRK